MAIPLVDNLKSLISRSLPWLCAHQQRVLFPGNWVVRVWLEWNGFDKIYRAEIELLCWYDWHADLSMRPIEEKKDRANNINSGKTNSALQPVACKTEHWPPDAYVGGVVAQAADS